MPKSQYVDPAKAFDAGYIHFEDIPVCQYNKTLAEEKKIYTKDDFMRIYRDMAIIRAMTAEGAPISEICAAFKPAWHEYRVGLYQKSLRQISEKRLKNALDACLEADRALKLSPQGYTALEQLICKF